MSESARIWGPDDSVPITKGESLGVIRAIKWLYPEPQEFTLLDIACGNAGLLQHISDAFPLADLTGIDLKRYNTWPSSQYHLHLIVKTVQELNDNDPYYDTILTMNTIRNWSPTRGIQNADFQPTLEAWLTKHGTYIIADGITYPTPWAKVYWQPGYPSLFYKRNLITIFKTGKVKTND